MVQLFSKHTGKWLCGLVLITLPALYFASKLKIHSDFKYLLPENKPSVVALNKIVDRVGGVSSLIVGVESDDHKSTERFIEALVVELRKLPEKYVRYIEYNVNETKSFFMNHKYLYTDLADLKEIQGRLKKKIDYEKLRHNPLYISLDDEKVDFDLSDIENKYKGKASDYENFIDGYFFSKDKRLAAVIIRPSGSSTGTGFAEELVQKIQSVIDRVEPQKFHPSMKTYLSGKYKTTLTEYKQLIEDMLETLALCLFLVALSLYLYFLRIRVIWLLLVPLVFGVAWTFAFTQFKIGHLNSQTAFLGSIIIGNGVNSGIILLARYLEERRKKKGIDESMAIAVKGTWLGTLTAALTTSTAFAALGLSEIKGLSEFGFIGGFGMLLCWIATYAVLPPLMILSERISPMIKGDWFVPKQWVGILTPLADMICKFPKTILSLGAAFFIACLFFMYNFLPNSLEYDFSKLRNKNPSPNGAPTVNKRIDDIFGQDLSPVVILLNDEKQAKEVCDAVMKKEDGVEQKSKIIDSCKSLRSFLPSEQDEKLKTLAEIRKLLNDSSLNFLSDKYKKELADFKKNLNLGKLTLEDLPDTVRRNFRERNGDVGKIVYVYPQRYVKLSDGKILIRFVDMLSNIRLPDGSVVTMSGESAVFADLLRAITRDGPLSTVVSFLLVTLVVVLQFRRKKSIAYILSGLTVGVVFMLGVQSIVGIKLNFFNFIALPTTFGIGVDYGVNLFQRYQLEGRGSIRHVLQTVGGAIALCSITTLIGYLTLLLAMSQAMVSFGWLSLIGEFACLFAALVIMPTIAHLFDSRKKTDTVENNKSFTVAV